MDHGEEDEGDPEKERDCAEQSAQDVTRVHGASGVGSEKYINESIAYVNTQDLSLAA
jgi:hypothetical protein